MANKEGRQTHQPGDTNEILTLMATTILLSGCRAIFFIIMADECVDCANNEELMVCFFYVDDQLAVHEELLGLYMCPGITAYIIIKVLVDVLLKVI